MLLVQDHSPQGVPGDLDTSLEGLGEAVGTVVNDNGQVPPSEEEREDDVGSNVAESAGDEHKLEVRSGREKDDRLALGEEDAGTAGIVIVSLAVSLG